MGKFDKFNKSNFKVKGLLALAIFFGFLILFIVTIVKLCLKKFRKEELKKNIEDSKNSNKDEYTDEEDGSSKKLGVNKKDYTQDATSDSNSYTQRKLKLISSQEKPDQQGIGFGFTPKIPKNVQKDIKKMIKKHS